MLGPAVLSRVPLIVSAGENDTTATPSIMLGSDLLNLLTADALDFGRAQVQIAFPRA